MPKRQGSLGNVGIMRFVFTNFQTDNYGTSSGNDEGNCVYNCMCNPTNIVRGRWSLVSIKGEVARL